ncbi:MAG: acetamidase/formamidase family protein [Gemmataceae bacterium]
MQRISARPLNYEFSRHPFPRATVRPGDTVLVEAEDALSGQIRKEGDQRDKTSMPYSNPVTGPIFVEGTEAGDALAVTIHEILSRDRQCATYTGNLKQLAEWLGNDIPHGAHVCPIRDGLIHWSDTITIPYQPMLGCIGTAPEWGVPTTLPAGAYGGNMDLVEVCPGSTVYLPVYVDGGYLFLGDAHAAMGHGELSATGLEMASETTITIDVIKGKKLSGPRIESSSEIMTVVSGCPMERSIAEAYGRLILWMEAEYGWSRWLAYDLLTHVGRISVGYYGIGTVATKVAKQYLGSDT